MIFDDEYSQIIIAGGGPAGCTASLFLAQKKIKHTLIEKEQFPRDKICGDALSGKVINILNKIDEKLVLSINNDIDKFNACNGIIFVAPDLTKAEIPFKLNTNENQKSPGYVAKRIDFDYFLFKQLNKKYCKVIENCQLTDVKHTEFGLQIESKHKDILYKTNCKLIVAADGAKSIISKKLANNKIDYNHYSAGMRAYYSGIKNLNPNGYIELIFLKEYLPGYLWIFPLPAGKANVGVGMLSHKIIEKKIDLKLMFENTIKNNSEISKRFENAIQETPLQGWGLPLASKKMKISGKNYLLCGDAASLIDPFTGEGVAPAMLSGKIASDIIEKAMLKNDFSAKILSNYDKEYYKATKSETRISYILQKLIKYDWLFNFVLKKISKNNELKNLLTMMFSDLDLRRKFINPLFYLKLFFKN